jgi:predicted RNA-binding protein YlxR (DUF448 family)
MSGIRRTCVGCRRAAGPDTLVRLVRTSTGELAVGRTHPGRGAWICAANPACFEQAARRGALTRALRGEVSAGAVESMRARLGIALHWGA